MAKLIKYEMRKQRTSRMVILIGLLVGVIAYCLSILTGNINMTAVIIGLGVCAALLVFFYTGIESILVLNRDLKTKQRYMLWMLPKSIWEILGAKFISALLQMAIVYAAFCIAVGIGCLGAVIRFEGVQALADMFQRASEAFVRGGVNWTDLVWLAVYIFIAWSQVIMIGFLAVVMSRTILLRSRFAGFLSVILFFVIDFVIAFGSDLMYRLPWLADFAGSPRINIWDGIYYLVTAVILFLVSGVLADKKLSV